MSLVRLSANDIDIILQLESGFCDGWNFSQLKSAFDSGRFFVLGEKDGENLIAFVSYSLAMEQADIETVFVKDEFRRRGIAKTLIERAQADAKSRGVQKVFLEVRENNVPARALYTSLGYEQISVRKGYYSDGENAVIMAKELL
ncbi:MAG: ribosomal protein S18-alanine N-acetyltransferase [Clostridia bacterium]|nr:ribosomal protein S18-alanine N-acetyltransferase [Clostridia bacterium]